MKPPIMKPASRVNHPPAVDVPADNRPLVAPIYQSVKFSFDSLKETERKLRGERDGYYYSRTSNPTLRQLELTLAELQGREACLLTASGVAAVNLAILALAKQNDHIICFAEMYQPTRYMVRRTLGRYGVRSTLLSIDHLEALERTLSETPTRLIVFETPTNPVLKVADVERITALARKHGALTVLDNTFAGFHNHGGYDIDVFVHSLTKYASGHGDVMGGAVIANKSLIDTMRSDFTIIGAALDPHAAFLIQRGLKTYFLRYERQCANALAVARFLESHPKAGRVRYPGLESDPGHALASKQTRDFGTIVTFELQGDLAAAERFADALKLFIVSASLGSTESLIQPGQLMRARDLTGEAKQWSEITDMTMRLSVGIEDEGDLIADLEQALRASD
jgi:cystathionine beta-lyase/cystathionine gamma-synthase